jgi:hypothetical protein
MPMLFTAASRNGSLDAAGLLLRTGRGLGSPRPGSDDVWTIAARTPAALRNVAAQIADTAAGLHLEITGLRDGDPAIEALPSFQIPGLSRPARYRKSAWLRPQGGQLMPGSWSGRP